MKKITLLMLLALPINVYAADLNGDYDATSLQRNTDEPGYKGMTGSKYQYDLSRPIDEIRYEVDIKAQMRDENSNSVRREIDRELGQRGGGIYD